MMYKFLSVVLSACLLTGSVSGPLMGYGMGQEVIIEESVENITVSGNEPGDEITVSGNEPGDETTVSGNEPEETTPEETAETEEESVITEEETTVTEEPEAEEKLAAEEGTVTFEVTSLIAYSNTIKVTIKTTANNYTGSSRTGFYYKPKNETEWKKTTNNLSLGYTTTISLSGLLEQTTYEYRVGLSPTDGVENLINPVSGEFTTPAEDRTVSLTELEVYSDNAIAKIELSGSQADNQTTYIDFYYKKKDGTSNYSRASQTLYDAGTAIVNVTGLSPDTEYEYIYGVKIQSVSQPSSLHTQHTGTFTTTSEDRTATYSNLKPLLHALKITVDVDGKSAAGNNTIYLHTKKKNDTSNFWSYTSATVTGDSAQTITMNGFEENTEYEYVIGIGKKSYSNDRSELLCTKSGTFKTLEDDRTAVVENIEQSLSSTIFHVSMKGKAMEGEKTKVYVCAWPEDEPETISYYFQSFEEAATKSFDLGGYYGRGAALKEDTKYEYSILIDVNKNGYNTDDDIILKKGSFQSLKDDRQVVVESIPRWGKADLNISLHGKAAGKYINNVKVAYKPKDGETWQTSTVSVYGNGSTRMTINTVNSQKIVPGMTYEYWAGIEKNVTTENGTEKVIIGKTEGEFSSIADARKIVSTKVNPNYRSASVVIKGVGMKEQASAYQLFYRKKGTTDWTYDFLYGTKTQNDEVTIPCVNLEPGTEYEYAVIIADNQGQVVPEEYEVGDKKVQGTFQTKEFTHSLQITQNTQKTTSDTATIDLEVTGTNQENSVAVKLYYAYADEWERSESIELYSAAKYKKTITLKDLECNASHDFIRAEFFVMEDGVMEAVGSKSLQGISFHTAQAPAISQITTSKDEVWLNVSSKSNLGYGKENITVGVLPEKAASDLYVKWTDVSKVNYALDGDTLQIEAVAVGDTGLVIGDGNASEVEKGIIVHVKNYAMGYPEDGELDTNDQAIIMSGGEIRSDVGYYDLSDKQPVLLEDVKVTSYDESKLEIKKEGNLYTFYAKKAGSTYVEFEKDNVKQLLQVQISDNSYVYDVYRLTSSDTNYPAIKDGEKNYVLALSDATYTTELIFESHNYEVSNTTFNWESSDTSVATVTNGVITPLKAGKTTITITSVYSDYSPSSLSFTVEVREVPVGLQASKISFVTNIKKNAKLKDVAFPEDWGSGWSWKYPETLIHAPLNGYEELTFEAICSGEGKYPASVEVNVIVQTITKININEVNGNHPNAVLELVNDSMQLQVYPENLGGADCVYVDLVCAKSGITIAALEDNTYKITAQKAGDYTLTANVYETKSNKKIMSSTYKIKAVKEKQVADIKVEIQGEEVRFSSDNVITFMYSNEKVERFSLIAKAYASDGTVLSTPIEWKSSDPKTISVTYNKKNPGKADFTIKKSGNVMIYATAKDSVKIQKALQFYNPCEDVTLVNNKAVVNLAYDYNSVYGGSDLGKNGCINFILPGTSYISSAVIQNADGTPDTKFSVSTGSKDGYSYAFIKPGKETIPTGTYKRKIMIRPSNYSGPYEYSVTISVVNKKPSVSVKTTKKANLFLVNDEAELAISMPKDTWSTGIYWTDYSDAEDGFELAYTRDGDAGKESAFFSSRKVKVIGKKPADANVGKGTLIVHLYGYKDPVYLKNVKMGYTYKKLTLKPGSKTLYVTPALGETDADFNIYTPPTNLAMSMKPSDTTCSPYYYYDLQTNNPRVTTTVNGSTVKNVYNSTKSKEVVEYTVSSYAWREPLKFKVTFQTRKPKVTLSTNTITFNRNQAGNITVGVIDKKAYNTSWTGIEFKGANAKAENLLKQNVIGVERYSGDSNYMVVRLNKTALDKQGNSVKDGTYSFKLTPYCKHPDSGEVIKLNTVTLKVKLVSKEITVKVTPKGTLDTLRSFESNGVQCGVQMNSKISNTDAYSSIKNIRLLGEYAEYFKLVRNYSSDSAPYYLVISSEGIGKVKSGHTYSFQIEYTFRAGSTSNRTFTVKSNTFKVKAKQVIPKLTVSPSSVMYFERQNDKSTKYFAIDIPDGYTVNECSGYLDINKDGQNDITVTGKQTSSGYCNMTVQINDYSAMKVSDSVTTYTVPVVLKMQGRDGIAKDPVVNMKVKVKR